jgi:hypothetical protein
MIEEREHYTGHPRLQAIYDLIGSRIQGYIAAYDLIGSRTRGYKPLTTLLDPESKVHKSPATSLGPEPNTQDKHTSRPELLRAVITTYSVEEEYIARLLVPPGP